MVMTVSFLNDCSYVAFELSLELRRRGWHVNYYPRSRSLISKTLIALFNVLKAKGIIHVNYSLQDAYMARVFKHLDVLHCHGSDVRWTLKGKWDWMVKSNINNAGKVLVSTSDLINVVKQYREDVEYLPNPVNTESFKPSTKINIGQPRAVYIEKSYELLPAKLKNALTRSRFALEKIEKNRYSYYEMPKVFNQYDLFIDRFTIESYSKSCLEAMSCGLPVITFKDKNNFEGILETLSSPENRIKIGKLNRKFILKNHDSKIIVDKLLEIYQLFGIKS